jgi:plasmid stability protein
MATLYVENVPEAVYKGLRERARKNRRSIAAEVIELLEKSVPTAEELQRRRGFVARLKNISTQAPLSPGPFPSAEEMVREDRER